MAKKKQRTSWQRKVFLEACEKLEPYASRYRKAGDDMQVCAVDIAEVMEDIIKRHGHPGPDAATAIASAWHWLLEQEDSRCDISEVSEDSIAAEYTMALWWLGHGHASRNRKK